MSEAEDFSSQTPRPARSSDAEVSVLVRSDLGAAVRRYSPVAIALLAFVGFAYLFSGVLTPFLVGIAIGYLLDPLADRLERLGLNRLGAALLILGGFVVVLAAGLVIVAPILGHQVSNFASAAPSILARLQSLLAEVSAGLAQSWVGEWLQKLGVAPAGENSADLQKWAGDLGSSVAGWVGSLLKSLISGGTALFGLLSLLVVTPVVAFYILVDWNNMLRSVEALIPPRDRANVRRVAHDIDRALAGFMRGQSMVCLFLGLWYGIGLSLIGLNFGFLIGMTAGVLSFIPYVGSLTALVVSLIVALAQDWPNWALPLKALAVVGVGQFLEGNILSPKLVGGSVQLHPVWLMFALLAGGSLAGFMGLIIAVPVAAALGVLTRYAAERYRQSPFFLNGADPADI